MLFPSLPFYQMFNPHSTMVRPVSPENPDPAVIAEAAAILRRGGLVAFPTETVYGLGANALDAAAVEGIFAAKGRPANNPVIVHVADAAAARRLTTTWPEPAERLAARFWPGPLTLVLPKHEQVPDGVTAGGSTVGVRVPAHPVALALLQAAEIPLAAPSANRSTRISPTTAQHVLTGLAGRVDLILDAGPTSGGLESTVLDLTVGPPRLLRPGLVTAAQLQEVVGPIDADAVTGEQSSPADSNATAVELLLKSPGLLERHYAPRTRLVCSAGPSDELVVSLLSQVNKVGWLRLAAQDDSSLHFRGQRVRIVEMPPDAPAYSQRLYAALHELDDAVVDCIVVDLPPPGDEWLAVHDRLRRASAGR